MEYFNFLGLPEVVQDLIVHEIVHNSIPEDRIQLARTCKYLNEAVKRAKPKKIVEDDDNDKPPQVNVVDSIEDALTKLGAEVKNKNDNKKDGEKFELVYPGDDSVSQSLNAYDPEVWPEVEFVEYVRRKR